MLFLGFWFVSNYLIPNDHFMKKEKITYKKIIVNFGTCLEFCPILYMKIECSREYEPFHNKFLSFI